MDTQFNAATSAEEEHRQHRESNIAASLAAGVKVPVADLCFYRSRINARYFPEQPSYWRNRKHGTVYQAHGAEFRVTDKNHQDNDRGSPLIVCVSYSPIETVWRNGRAVFEVQQVCFTRDLSAFLQKFEAVTPTSTWEAKDWTPPAPPGTVY